MGLIDDQGVIGLEQWIALGLCQQDAIGHEFDRGACGRLVRKADLITHILTHWRSQLMGDALGGCRSGNAAWLGMTNQAAAIHGAAAELQTNLRQLRSFARTGLAAHDHHLARA